MKIGIIGAALSHPAVFTKAIREFKLAEVIGLWAQDTEQNRASRFSEQLGLAIYDKVGKLIADSDALVVTTQTNLHKQYALMALAGGKPVFVDKPFATCYEDAQKVIDKAASADVAVMSCSVRRFTPAFESIASAVRSGQVGRPISAIRFEPHGVSPGDWQDRIETSGGFIFNFGIHCVDTLQRVLGPKAEEVNAYADKLEVKNVESHDTAVITIRFANGSIGIAEVIGSMKPGDKLATAPSLRVFCTENSLQARMDENYAYEYVGTRFGVSPYYELNAGVVDTIKAFVKMAETGEPVIPYEEMLEVIKILEAARISASEKRRVLLSEI